MALGTASWGIDTRPGSSGNRFRANRFRLFWSLVETIRAEKGQCTILDVGGTSEFWRAHCPDLPSNVHVVLANLSHVHGPADHPNIADVIADACSMPQFADNEFDIVHSNSVIEHVGLWQNIAAMAAEIQRVAPRHFVQTPNYWFPIEPHARYPLFQFLPEPWRASLLMKKSRGFWQRANDIGDATRRHQSANLLTYEQMRFLFPDSQIRREMVGPLTKSLIAIRR